MKSFKSLYLLATLVLLIGFNSCSDSKEELNEQVNYESELRSSSYENLQTELSGIWNNAWEIFGMDLICSCDCDGAFTIRDVLKYHTPNFNGYRSLGFDDMNCDDLKDVFKQECNYSDLSSYEDYIASVINSNTHLTNEEKDLIDELLKDAKIGLIDRNKYQNLWNNLATRSESNNKVSHFIIETSLSIQTFVNSNPDVFDDGPQALLGHIAGAIAGAAVSLTAHIVIEGHLDGEGFLDALKYGAIGGAVGAI